MKKLLYLVLPCLLLAYCSKEFDRDQVDKVKEDSNSIKQTNSNLITSIDFRDYGEQIAIFNAGGTDMSILNKERDYRLQGKSIQKGTYLINYDLNASMMISDDERLIRVFTLPEFNSTAVEVIRATMETIKSAIDPVLRVDRLSYEYTVHQVKGISYQLNRPVDELPDSDGGVEPEEIKCGCHPPEAFPINCDSGGTGSTECNISFSMGGFGFNTGADCSAKCAAGFSSCCTNDNDWEFD